VKVVTRGPETRYGGVMADGTIKIVLNAPPVDGRANHELTEWLSLQFGTARENVTILSGKHSRRKAVRVEHPRESPSWFQPGC